MVKANEHVLREYGRNHELTDDWTRDFSKSADYEISRVVLDHDISLDLVFNLDQIPLSYVSPGKYSSI